MTRRPLRVCFVAPYGYPVLAHDRALNIVGGAEVQQSFIAPELARRGHAVSMVSLDFGQNEGDVVSGVSLLTTHTPDAGVPGLRFVHPRITSVWRALKRANADVYYQRSAGALTGIVAAFARAHRRKAVYAGASDLDFDPGLPKLPFKRDRLICRYGLHHVDQIVVQTERQRELCRSGVGREAERVPSCYGHVGQPARHDGPILWVGTVKDLKRPEIFLELARRLPEYRFRLVGGAFVDGAYCESIRQQAAALPNVEQSGFVPYADVETHIDGASMLVNTTESEGFPNTFLQAWSRGMPTVSFFDADAREAGQTVGCVVTDTDTMVAKIRALKTAPDVWQAEGRRAADYFARHHGVVSVGDQYESILERVAAGGVPS